MKISTSKMYFTFFEKILGINLIEWPVLNKGYIILNIMYRNDKVIRRYSEPFKLKILAELTIGKHRVVNSIQLHLQLLICRLKSKNLMNIRVKTEKDSTNDNVLVSVIF
jgi:hypothetical protein